MKYLLIPFWDSFEIYTGINRSIQEDKSVNICCENQINVITLILKMPYVVLPRL